MTPCTTGCKETKTVNLTVKTCKKCERIIRTKSFYWDILGEALKILEYTQKHIKPTVITRDNEKIETKIGLFLDKVKDE